MVIVGNYQKIRTHLNKLIISKQFDMKFITITNVMTYVKGQPSVI